MRIIEELELFIWEEEIFLDFDYLINIDEVIRTFDSRAEQFNQLYDARFLKGIDLDSQGIFQLNNNRRREGSSFPDNRNFVILTDSKAGFSFARMYQMIMRETNLMITSDTSIACSLFGLNRTLLKAPSGTMDPAVG